MIKLLGIDYTGYVILSVSIIVMSKIMESIKKLIYKLFIENSPLQGYVAHTPHGLFTVFAAVYVHWVVALLFGAGFVIFEWIQQKNRGDWAHQDIAGWLLGIVLGSIAAFAIRILG